MTPRRARYAKIERLVETLLGELAVQAPVPIERLVKRHAIEIRVGDLGEVSGLLMRSVSGATIGVNSTQSRTRQRFTIAHEFGHFLLHDGIVEHVDHGYRIQYRSDLSSQATDVDEIEANFFAATLLMPGPLLAERNAVAALDDDGMVRALASAFQVSPHAMSLRLSNLYRRYAPF